MNLKGVVQNCCCKSITTLFFIRSEEILMLSQLRIYPERNQGWEFPQEAKYVCTL